MRSSSNSWERSHWTRFKRAGLSSWFTLLEACVHGPGLHLLLRRSVFDHQHAMCRLCIHQQELADGDGPETS
jgi:hypothetical protein